MSASQVFPCRAVAPGHCVAARRDLRQESRFQGTSAGFADHLGDEFDIASSPGTRHVSGNALRQCHAAAADATSRVRRYERGLLASLGQTREVHNGDRVFVERNARPLRHDIHNKRRDADDERPLQRLDVGGSGSPTLCLSPGSLLQWSRPTPPIISRGNRRPPNGPLDGTDAACSGRARFAEAIRCQQSRVGW